MFLEAVTTTASSLIDLSTIDFQPILLTLGAVVGATLTVVVSIIGIKKGVAWFKSMIKGA